MERNDKRQEIRNLMKVYILPFIPGSTEGKECFRQRDVPCTMLFEW
jgi:hypothetical protein